MTFQSLDRWHCGRVILDHPFFHLDAAKTDRAAVLPQPTDLWSALGLLPACLFQSELESPVLSIPSAEILEVRHHYIIFVRLRQASAKMDDKWRHLRDF